MKLHKGDTVQVLIGKDKGKTSTIEKVLPSLTKVLVANVNQYKRHVKGRAAQQKSEIVTITKPISVANVMLVCPKCHLATRLGYRITDTTKERICKKCQQVI